MSKPASPVAKKIPHRIEQLGRVRVDDYAWMKDENWQQVLRDPKVLRGDIRDHLDAENAYAKAMLAGTELSSSLMRPFISANRSACRPSVPARIAFV